MAHISATELKSLLDAQPGLPIIDVRTPAEFEQIHAVSAVNVPLDKLSPAAVKAAVNLGGGQPFYILCHSGARADIAATQLESAGLTQGIVIKGGTNAWNEAGFPVIKGTSKVISLERQVRIGAGSLVLAGLLLGLLVHPGLFALTGFVGAGLVFAGATDWCGMGLLLSKAPWNKITTI
jgi:rhodanese-related sulfurtransferase